MHVHTVCTIVWLWGKNYLKKEQNIISIHDKENKIKKKEEKMLWYTIISHIVKLTTCDD